MKKCHIGTFASVWSRRCVRASHLPQSHGILGEHHSGSWRRHGGIPCAPRAARVPWRTCRPRRILRLHRRHQWRPPGECARLFCIPNARQNQDDDTLKSICGKSIDKPVNITVYSAKDQSVRGLPLLNRHTPRVICMHTDLVLVPSNTWGGEGLLGVSIRFCSFESATENIWHILVRELA